MSKTKMQTEFLRVFSVKVLAGARDVNTMIATAAVNLVLSKHVKGMLEAVDDKESTILLNRIVFGQFHAAKLARTLRKRLEDWDRFASSKGATWQSIGSPSQFSPSIGRKFHGRTRVPPVWHWEASVKGHANYKRELAFAEFLDFVADHCVVEYGSETYLENILARLTIAQWLCLLKKSPNLTALLNAVVKVWADGIEEGLKWEKDLTAYIKAYQSKQEQLAAKQIAESKKKREADLQREKQSAAREAANALKKAKELIKAQGFVITKPKKTQQGAQRV